MAKPLKLYVEIITSDFAVCNPNWLNFVVTNKARSAIRNHLKEFKERDAIALGGQLLNAELKEAGVPFNDISPERLTEFLDEQHLNSLDALLMDIGFGNRMPLVVAYRLITPIGADESAIDIGKGDQSTATLNIHGAEGVLINLASCCRPIPGDKIIGFFSPGRGVVVHRVHCKNTREYKRKHIVHRVHCKNTREYKRKHKSWLNVQWTASVEGECSTDIRIEVADQRGSLAEIASILSSYDCNIENIDMGTPSAGSSVNIVTITVRDSLRMLPSIMKLSRVRN